MHTYRAYGFVLASDLALPELTPATGEAEVFIRRQPLHLEEAGAGANGESVITGQVLDLLRFRIENGTHILIEEMRPVTEDEIRVFLLGVLMSTLLRQRGLLVLHASGLARDGRAIGFVGDSGWGKSTLAGYFVQQGYRLVNDDVLAVDLGASPVHILPGFPQIKLRPEAEQWLGQAYDSLPQLHENSIKRITAPVAQFQEADLPLAALYVIEGAGREETRVVPLKPADAVIELVRHTRMTNIMRAPAVQARHLAQCGQLVRSVPVRLLERKRDLSALDRIREVVEADLGTLYAT